MKKIAYIEIDTHAEIAADFMNLMNDSENFSVDYYYSQKVKNQIKTNTEAVFLSDNSMILDQLKSKKYDLVIIGTVHRYFNTFLNITNKYKTAVIVHNLNFSKASKLNLIKNVFKEDVIYRVKLWWKEGLFNASKVYKKSKNLLVLDKGFSAQEYQFLPLFYTKPIELPVNKIFTVVVPGGVSQKRRDYKNVCKVIFDLEDRIKRGYKLKNPLIEFVFLGKAKDDELKGLVDLERSLEHVNITYFKERVSQQDFEMWMKKADVLWCPIQQQTEFFSQKEVYGKTKMTGNIGDAIKFGKIAVFPKNYTSNLDFIVTEKENVIEQFYELQNVRYDFQKEYNKQIVLKNLENLLQKLSF
ncbi:hypothetical protein NAL32_11630 [Chryseobacterium sp. Ch-15]|uniref:Uncharacterized protein n=1 Tax=Chryseobacterium muglaense TaxID=2893752 RepID=A0A9Q3YRC9_9FLAO|nr:hypothetical protein [Chryseobacterium muglaense]MBD3905251.1 hypothetical protein [Chryseobacterium muglaense]MCC9034043.1 hypothetical protein [Chryseobacterium muglaense]MCM2555036.1 hypothetical protein [Chryseobacterium muglaense]